METNSTTRTVILNDCYPAIPVESWLSCIDLPDPICSASEANLDAMRTQFAEEFPGIEVGRQLDVQIAHELLDRYIEAACRTIGLADYDAVQIIPSTNFPAIFSTSGDPDPARLAAALATSTLCRRLDLDAVVVTSRAARRLAKGVRKSNVQSILEEVSDDECWSIGEMLDELLAEVDRDVHPDGAVLSVLEAFTQTVRELDCTYFP